MRWYEYKMEVDDLHASDDLKAKLLALQANAAETPGAKSIAMPAPSPTPKKQKKPLRFPARRWAQLAACAAVCGVCLYGAVYAYEWKGVTLLGGGSSSNYSAAATRAAAPQAAVYSMEDTENATYGSADNGISSFSAEDGHRSADTATGGSLLTSGEAESDASTRTADSAKIIYTANLTLETRDYDTARAALDAALSDADGYMASSGVSERYFPVMGSPQMQSAKPASRASCGRSRSRGVSNGVKFIVVPLLFSRQLTKIWYRKFCRKSYGGASTNFLS